MRHLCGGQQEGQRLVAGPSNGMLQTVMKHGRVSVVST